MEIIVPAAGLSSRFPNMKPKYLLADYKKHIMLESAIAQYVDKYRVTVGVLREHEETYHATKHIRAYLGDRVNIVILDQLTRGPAETVYKIIELANIDPLSPILIKDCDSFFNHDESGDNYICISKINQHDILKKLHSKSFVISNDQAVIQNIVEKSVVSDTFCVGAYKFRSALMFTSAFDRVSNISEELFVSHVIQDCLATGEVFIEKPVNNYTDVGTFTDWYEYNDKPVFFCDIDGSIVHAQAHDDTDKYATPLPNNVEVLLEWYRKGAQFIFTTARKESNRADTIKLLKSLGFEDFQLICGLQNARRIVINDYNEANPYPRAEAINLYRDTDNLKHFLK